MICDFVQMNGAVCGARSEAGYARCRRHDGRYKSERAAAKRAERAEWLVRAERAEATVERARCLERRRAAIARLGETP